jgi:D-3-phosphoglycerate dehydrogenase
MKVLAIGDTFIPEDIMEAGVEQLKQAGFDVTVRQWKHANLEALQKDNLLIEQGGPGAVVLPEDIFRDIHEYEVIIVQFTPISQKILKQATKLKLIGVLRGGIENVDITFATSKGIAVANTPGRNARAVAEFTVGLMLSEIRNIARSHAALKDAVWLKQFPNSGEIPELFGKTVGMVGLGHIGQLVSGYLNAFGCRIIAYDPYVKNAEGIELMTLPEVMKQSDIVSIHARYTVDTHHLISKKEIALMKPGAILINTARSGLVDQEGLVQALKEKQIRGAGLDVFDVEPIPEKDEILKLHNITITPHLAGSTADAFTNSPKLFSNMLLQALKQGKNGLAIINDVKFNL